MTRRGVGECLLVGCLQLLTACKYPYHDAAHAFAESAQTGVAGVRPMFATAAELCRERANLDYLGWRLEQLASPQADIAAVAPWAPAWVGFFEQRLIRVGTKEVTWKEHCTQLAQYDVLLGKGLSALVEYAKALDRLAKEADVDEKVLASLGDSAHAIAIGLVDPEGLNPNIAQIKNVVGPIQKLAGALRAARVEKELKGAVLRADAQVQVIVKACKDYATGMRVENADIESRWRSVLQRLEVAMGERLPRPADLLAFYRFATEYEKASAARSGVQSGYEELLDDLSTAHSTLKAAGEAKLSDREALVLILELAQAILDDAIAVRNTARGE